LRKVIDKKLQKCKIIIDLIAIQDKKNNRIKLKELNEMLRILKESDMLKPSHFMSMTMKDAA
jgi:hypothetical protein